MYEDRFKPLLSRPLFYRRLARHASAAFGLMLASLLIGMCGYHAFEQMSWVDAFCNASMILSGMGPASDLKTDGGKIFAGIYALFSGLAFVVVVSLLLAPVIHRLLHVFHIETPTKKGKGSS